MAKAERTTTTITQTVEVEESRIHLELTLDEATTLRQVVDKIGGCPVDSARRHTDAVSQALAAAGIPRTTGRAEGSIYFYCI